MHHLVLHLADAKIETVGESRSVHLFSSQGLPMPVPQFEIFRPNGIVAGRVDFAWPELQTMAEFDGLGKYHRFRRPGETIEDMLIREKRREDLLRGLTGWTMIRITWADLALPFVTAALIRHAFSLRSAAGRHGGLG